MHKKSGGCMKTTFEKSPQMILLPGLCRKPLSEGIFFGKSFLFCEIYHYRNSAFPVMTRGLGYLKNDNECLLWNRYKCQNKLVPFNR